MAKIVIGLIVIIILAGMATGQDRLKDVPIVSDKAVERSDTLRIVDKDEQQRIITRLVKRIQKLENRVTTSEIEIRNLKEQIEGG